MSLSAAIVDALIDAGATREQLAAAVKADIAERGAAERERLEVQKEGNRRRQRNKRERDGNAVSRNVTEVTRDACDTPPEVSPKDNTQTSSSPPAEVSEPNGSSPQPRPWALPAGVSLQVWTDFLSNRKRKHLGNTTTAWKAFQDDLKRVSSRTGIPPPKLIEHAAAKGWGSINAPDEDQGHGRTNGQARSQPNDGLSPTTRAARSVFGSSDAGHLRTIPQ